MTLRRRRALVVLVAAAIVAVVAAVVEFAVGGSSSKQSSSSGAPTGVPAGSQLSVTQCAPVKGPRWIYPGQIDISSSSYELFATGYSCSAATSWTQRLIAGKLPNRTAGNASPLSGVSGFTCVGYPDKNGNAYAGACRKVGTIVEFGWNINVINRPITTDVAGEDIGRTHTAGSDANTVIRMLAPGRYELVVNNTSNIGFINAFSWAPPAGMVIKAVTRSSGGRCSVASDGNIACSGSLQPPKCLCQQNGGELTVDFTASGGTIVTEVNGHPVISGGPVAGTLQIGAMTPVPYLIPSTPQAARHRGL